MKNIIICECYDCEKETNQDILYSHHGEAKELYEGKKGKVSEKNEYFIVKCRGCNYVSFLLKERIFYNGKETNCTNESFPDSYKDGEDDDEFNFLSEDEIRILPRLVKNLYQEVEEVFCIDVPILIGIGLRALLEAICLNEKIPGKNLMEKIDNLHKKGFIAEKSLPVLHNLRLIGNEITHEMKKPAEKTLDYSLAILHHIIRNIYITPYLHEKIKK